MKTVRAISLIRAMSNEICDATKVAALTNYEIKFPAFSLSPSKRLKFHSTTKQGHILPPIPSKPQLQMQWSLVK